MGKNKKPATKGNKLIVTLDAYNNGLEERFRTVIEKGGKISIKAAGEYDNDSDFAMFIKDGLEKGDFTKVELLEAIYEDDAEYEYGEYKDNYGDGEDDPTNNGFVNFIQNDHGPYSAVLVCETNDKIYLAMIEECDETEAYYNMFSELALAVTHSNAKPTTEDINRMVTEKAKEAIKKLHTTDNPPTVNYGTVDFGDIIKSVNGDDKTAMAKALTTPIKLNTPPNNIKPMFEPMFMKL